MDFKIPGSLFMETSTRATNRKVAVPRFAFFALTCSH
jgi:hypothetical protein